MNFPQIPIWQSYFCNNCPYKNTWIREVNLLFKPAYKNASYIHWKYYRQVKKLNISILSPFFFAVIHKKVYSKQSLFKTYVIIRYAFIAMLSRQKSAKICRHTLLFPKPMISCLAWLVIWLAIIIRSLITVRKRLRLTALFCLGARLPIVPC